MAFKFWSDPTVEPKRAYRWLLYINAIPQWVIKTAEKPGYEITESEHNYLNHTFWYPARLKWRPVKFTLVDPVEPDCALTIMNMIQNSGYHFPVDQNDTATISKARAVAELGSVKLVQLDPDGEPLEEWAFKNAWIKDVNNGTLDYSSDELVNLELQLRFDWAQINRTPRSGQPAVELKF